jgi:hypothetical protein
MGLNNGNVQLFHVENGTTVPMTRVDAPSKHNEFSYDPLTGNVTLSMSGFSEVTVVAEARNPWDGSSADRFAGGPVGIWLDTGHAIMMEEMGLQQLPLSKKVADMIVGMHIHDAVDALDHYAPCTLPGDVLNPYREYIVNSPIKVLELSGRLTAEEIITGTERFVERYGK